MQDVYAAFGNVDLPGCKSTKVLATFAMGGSSDATHQRFRRLLDYEIDHSPWDNDRLYNLFAIEPFREAFMAAGRNL